MTGTRRASRDDITAAMCEHGRALFDRGYTVSTGGNLSHRLGEGFLMQATGTSLGRMRPTDFVLCRAGGDQAETGPVPSKETPIHAEIYRRRPDAVAIVHLHAEGSIALGSMSEPTDSGNALPVVSIYAATRVGRVPLLELIPPGTPRLAERIGQVCAGVQAVLLAHHGLVAWSTSLDAAVDVAEVLEHSARAWLLTGGKGRVLTDAEIESLRG